MSFSKDFSATKLHGLKLLIVQAQALDERTMERSFHIYLRHLYISELSRREPKLSKLIPIESVSSSALSRAWHVPGAAKPGEAVSRSSSLQS